MNTIDIVLAIIILIAFFMGFRKGLLRALASLVGIVLAIYGAIYFSSYMENVVSRFNWSNDITKLVAFIATFALIMVFVLILGRVLTKVVDVVFLGPVNKILGGIFNAIKYAFLVSVVFMFVNNSDGYTIMSDKERHESVLYEPVASIAPLVLPTILIGVDRVQEEFEDPTFIPQQEKPLNKKLPDSSESFSI